MFTPFSSFWRAYIYVCSVKNELFLPVIMPNLANLGTLSNVVIELHNFAQQLDAELPNGLKREPIDSPSGPTSLCLTTTTTTTQQNLTPLLSANSFPPASQPPAQFDHLQQLFVQIHQQQNEVQKDTPLYPPEHFPHSPQPTAAQKSSTPPPVPPPIFPPSFSAPDYPSPADVITNAESPTSSSPPEVVLANLAENPPISNECVDEDFYWWQNQEINNLKVVDELWNQAIMVANANDF